MSMKKRSLFLAALWAAAGLLTASTAIAADSVKIGVLMPLIGNAAAAGLASKAAIERRRYRQQRAS
jgi:ABC-type sugar transport system substrate-binding protein